MLAIKLRSGNKFSLVRTYTVGTAATETVPTGASMVKMTADAGGGAGAFDPLRLEPTGGGGGGRVVKTIAVIPGDSLIYTVAAARPGRSTQGNGADGLASSVSGTVSGGTVAMAAGGGKGGPLPSIAGFGGSAAGGDVNTIGGPGGTPDGGASAAGAPGGAGLGAAGIAPGGGGAGAETGASGAGARGQIIFEYS